MLRPEMNRVATLEVWLFEWRHRNDRCFQLIERALQAVQIL
jgi:hypothetical protein